MGSGSPVSLDSFLSNLYVQFSMYAERRIKIIIFNGKNLSVNIFSMMTLHVARVAKEMFQQSHGDRPGIPNYIVVITDGYFANGTLTWMEAVAARAQGITIVAVSL